MDDIYCLLQQIRKRPGLYIRNKSLTALGHFLHGYNFRQIAELWMKSTGIDFTSDYDYFIRTLHLGDRPSCLDGFNQFVYEYYGVEMSAKDGETVIKENTNSEEEAFDKFYEILDLYFSEQGISGDSYGNNNPF